VERFHAVMIVSMGQSGYQVYGFARNGLHTEQFKSLAVRMVCHSMCCALNIISLP
jgi:hypothetical protein